MKAFFLSAFLFCCAVSHSQYYYKDIVGTRESSDMIRVYLKNKVSRVVLTSFNSTNQKDDNFFVEQQFNVAERLLQTHTRSYITDESTLISYADASGNIIRTVDSSDEVVSTPAINMMIMETFPVW